MSLLESPRHLHLVRRRPARMLVVGNGSGSRVLGRYLSALRHPAVEVVGIAAPAQPTDRGEWPYLGHYDHLSALLDLERIDEVALCLEESDWHRIDSLVQLCGDRGVPVWIPPPQTGQHGGDILSPTVRRGQSIAKRGLDLLGSVMGLIVLAPLLVGTAIAIRRVDGPPVLFRQRRAGLGGRQFTIMKFRTMDRDADSLRSELRANNEVKGGASFKLRDDPRVTTLGKWLRRTSIDELPQLWNVLKGEMSLVGPRPHPYDDVAGYQAWHVRRLTVKPGITGLWQVDLRGDSDFDRWVAKDIEYIERSSMWLDLKIIARTIPAVLRGSGQ